MPRAPRCLTAPKVLMAFLNATGGNWRNSLYVDCRVCRLGRCDNPDFLYVPGEDGGVILLPAGRRGIPCVAAAGIRHVKPRV